jgi:hypothetical protein
MNTTQPEVHRTVEVSGKHDATYQGYQILHWGFVALPVIAGLDKFTHLLTNWDTYLAPPIASMLGGFAHTFMLIVGAVEVFAGLLVALKPKIGAWVVAGWLGAIIVNLLMGQNNGDIALRDLGLCIAAIALGRLSMTYDHQLEGHLRST